MLAGQVHAQSVFNVLDSSAFLNSTVLEINNTYVVASDLWSIGGSKTAGLFKYDSNGVLVEGDTLNNYPVLSAAGKLSIINDKIGLLNLIDHTPPFSGSFRDLEFSIFSDVGSELFSIEYGGSLEEFPNSIKVISENEVLIYGSTDSFSDPSGDLYLFKIDTNGVIQWEKTYGGVEAERAFSFNRLKDGNFLLSGDRRISSSDWNIYLVKVDTSGNVIWEKDYGGSYTDYAGLSTQLNDHSFIVCRSVDDGSTLSGYIEKLDGNGDLVWSKQFLFDGLSYSYGDPIENSDGTVVINASVKNSQNMRVGKLIKITPLGDTVWTKEYYTRPDLPQYIYDIKPTDDGGYILCGSTFPVGSNTAHAWLIKTNCLGEDGTQYPVSGAPCDQYDCTWYPIDASFTPSTTYIDLAVQSGLVTFENNSANTTSRVWNFGDGITDYTDSIITHTYTQPGIYEVELIVFHGMCSDTITQTIEVVNTSGFYSPYLDFGMKVFPNPSDGNLKVQFTYPPQGEMLVVDMTGRVCRSFELDAMKQSFNIENLNSGSYSLVLHHLNGTTVTEKVIIH